MTTAETSQTPEDDQGSTETADSKETGGGLRKELERSKAENKTLRESVRINAFSNAGIDTSTGLGKAIAQVYDGENTAEAIQKFANEEYGWVATQQVADHPAAQAIHEGNARQEQMQQQSGSIVPPTNQDALAKAEAEGDWDTTMAIKSRQVQEMFDRQRMT